MRVTESAKKRVEWINKHYDKTVRLAVHGGGCAGFRYEFDMADAFGDDVVIDAIHVDPTSLELLHNAVVDFVTGLHGQYFKVQNEDAVSSCGCGKSFSIA